jgi:hypothetical protein
MPNLTKIALAVAVTLASAAPALAISKNHNAYGANAAVQATPAVRSARAAERVAVRPFTQEERNWFRQAEGPEWN